MENLPIVTALWVTDTGSAVGLQMVTPGAVFVTSTTHLPVSLYSLISPATLLIGCEGP